VKIRIIAGEFGGRVIAAPKGHTTHPMSERVRNALFNQLGSELKDTVVLDAFAGTGAIGLEALSRGAKHVVFVERDVLAFKILTENIDYLGVSERTNVSHAAVSTWAKSTRLTFNLIFADPPYDDTQLSTVTELFGLLKPNGLMVLSYPGKGEAPTGTNGVVVVDNRSYGTAALAFYRKKDA